MNRRLSALLAAAFALATPLASRAVIEPVVIRLSADNTDYTVPADKVLVLESAYSGNRFGTNTSFALIGNSVTNVIYVDSWYRKITPIQPPLKFPEGWTLRLFDPGEQFLLLFGLLVDPGDLYAAVESRFEYARAASQDLDSRLSLASPRQAVIRLDATEDLMGGSWMPLDGALSPVTTNRGQWDVRAAMAGLERQYYRAAVRSRTGPGGIKHD